MCGGFRGVRVCVCVWEGRGQVTGTGKGGVLEMESHIAYMALQ